MKDLGNRMKAYEGITRHYLVRRTPVIIRVDGKAFHTLLRGTEKPFDNTFITCMQEAVDFTVREIQGCKMAYVQSDEASFLLTDYDKIDTQGWFDYNLAKMISISAAKMSVVFNHLTLKVGLLDGLGLFDSRAFNIPKEEVSNYFLWRAKDWQRNSLNMYAGSFFSHKQLMNKHSSEIHEMLHSIGKNWAMDLDPQLKNGSWIIKDQGWRYNILPTYESISKVVNPLIGLEE